jgi:signal transduction histidine kinase
MARLRALDSMLGGVAHDLNNALSVVLMNLDVMQQDAAVAKKHERRLDGMFDSMTGASSLVRHLLNFSHSRRPAPEIVSLAEALPPLIELVQAAVGRDIAARLEQSDCGPCCAMVDQASFEVAVVHLALQLAQGVRRGSDLVFTLATRPAAVSPSANPAEQRIELTIEIASEASAADLAAHTPDLEMAERFAQNAQGTLAFSHTEGGARIMLDLPSCSATTTV